MKDNLKKILYIISGPYKLRIFFISVLTLIMSALEVFSVALIIPLLSNFVNDSNIAKEHILYFGKYSNDQIFIIILTLFLFVFFLKNIFLIFFNLAKNSFLYAIFFDVSNKIFKNYLNKQYSFFVKKNSSEFIRNITGECNIFSFGVVSPIIVLISDTIIIVFITIFLLFYNFWPTLFVILFIILFSYFLLKLTNKKFKEWGIIRQNFSSKILQNLQESFGYIKEIILSGYQNFFLKRHSESNIENSKASIKRDVYSILPRPLLECITLLTFYFLILIFLTLKINKSEIFILIGIIFFASIKLLPSISNIIKSLQLVRYNFSSVNVIYNELKNIKIIPKNLKKNLRVMKFLKIEFNNVSFLYEGQKKNVIKNLSLKIKINDKIGIMGKSGSGKTTFLNLLAGLLSPISGVIKVNDLITDFGSSEWKRKIGYAHQNTFLADDTVLFNITFKNKIKKNEYSRLLKVLKVTELHDYIKTLEFGIHTKIGENGCQFSGGQRQRLGIARVLFKNPSMIILDEATSALDEQMENRILKSIFNKMKNQIIIIVSHRKNTLKHCNKQFLFANGRLFKR